ncbi:MAG: hypothetical protein LBH57_10105, partial [Treponema sp.]|jgi:hypothetical protein|nr:hypothetical protein [Treponema sp.]
VLLLKGGKVSAPVVINTTKGNGKAGWEWGTGRFVAVTQSSGKAVWSTDGKNWNTAELPPESYWGKEVYWDEVAYGGGVFVAVSSTDNYAIRSDDGGETWEPVILPSSDSDARPIWKVIYGDGVFMAINVVNGDVAWSDNGGKTWNLSATLPRLAQAVPEPDREIIAAYNLTYGDGVFVALAQNGNYAAWSDDGGKNWNVAETLPPSGPYYFYHNRAAYGEGVFVSTIMNDSGGQTVWSDDGGRNWNVAETLPGARWEPAVYGDGVFVTVASGGSNQGNQAAWSDDGKNWKVVATPPTTKWYNLTYGNGVFVALADNKAVWSVDGGKTWGDAELPSFSPRLTNSGWAVGYGNGVFVATVYGINQVAWSADGKNWEAATLPCESWWEQNIVYGEP